MMDADGRIIPVVEDDQGEGIKDPLTFDDILKMGHIKARGELHKLFQKEMERQDEKVRNNIGTTSHFVRKVLSRRGK